MSLQTTDSITLKIWDRASMERSLDTAVKQLSTGARAAKCGILVTRRGPNTFTVSLSRSVPFGTTVEKVTW